jgi:Na+/proline symporter
MEKSMENQFLSFAVFLIGLMCTYFLAWYGRQKSKEHGDDDLAGRSLNKWVVGLSAGATANSGFIVAGAVGLGYSYGLQWVMMPLAWFIGDLVFWRFFPQRMNAFGRKHGVVTLSELLKADLSPGWARAVSAATATVLLFGLGGYVISQWFAGQKFLLGAFGLEPVIALALFAAVIIGYSALGGFRGSVYVDSFQAVLRLIGTMVIFIAAGFAISKGSSSFSAEMAGVDDSFFFPFPGMGFAGIVGFIVGWAAAGLGFGLGQPQLVSRYLATKSPEETYNARWIYMGYVQFTWISMTVFGMLLRGIAPGLEDPESGLSVFLQAHMYAVFAGLILADVFGVIASTANSLLISLAQSIKHDVIGGLSKEAADKTSIALITSIVGVATMFISFMVQGSVAEFALGAASLIGAGLAAPVMIKLLGLRHTGASLMAAIFLGLLVAIGWSTSGMSSFINEAAVGIAVSWLTNHLVLLFSKSNTGLKMQ